MRTHWRFALALLVSGLLHLAWLAWPVPPAATGRAGLNRPLTVSLRAKLSPQPAPARLLMGGVPQAGSRPLPAPKALTPPAAPATSAASPPDLFELIAAASVDEPAAEPAAAAADSSLPAWLAELGFGPEDDPVYYAASELDQRASPLGEISLAFPPDLPAHIGAGRVELELKIDQFGVVNEVNVLAADPPGWFEAAAIASFSGARWQPAVRGGRFVKSIKRVEVCFGPCLLQPAKLNPP